MTAAIKNYLHCWSVHLNMFYLFQFTSAGVWCNKLVLSQNEVLFASPVRTF